MPLVELVYDSDCPNLANARAQLLRAFVRVGLEARWTEWQTDEPEAPPHVRGYGSPTVVVNGRDVAGATPVAGMRGCRVYANVEGEPRGAPPVEVIVAALQSGGTRVSGGEHGSTVDCADSPQPAQDSGWSHGATIGHSIDEPLKGCSS
jgi:hypothetical protein